MGFKLIAETDLIEVKTLCVMIYGPPGAWKTSTAQTANGPLTLDFDKGIHRAFNRKTAGQLDHWGELEQAEAAIDAAQTIVVDTVGRCLDLLTADVIRCNRSHGSASGGLNLQGWGALKTRFATWVALMRGRGKDMVFLAHEKELKDGDNRYMRPDIQGSSYQEVFKIMDVAGYIGKGEGGSRYIRFEPPHDKQAGKDPCGWKTLTVPNLADSPTWLADRLAEAKKIIGVTAAASAAHAAALKEWSDWLARGPELATFNEKLALMSALSGTAKRDIWDMVKAHAAGLSWTFDATKKKFLSASTPTPAATIAKGDHIPGVDDPEGDPDGDAENAAMRAVEAAAARN